MGHIVVEAISDQPCLVPEIAAIRLLALLPSGFHAACHTAGQSFVLELRSEDVDKKALYDMVARVFDQHPA